MDNLLLLPLLGFVAGFAGALIGAGGGFILVPILLVIAPDETPGIITGISQTVVFATSLSATVAYARQGRIEYRWAALLGAAGVAGMAVGAFITENLSRETFQLVFGFASLIVVAYLLIRPIRGRGARSLTEARTMRIELRRRHIIPVAAVGFATSVLGGLLGLGGGIALTPVLIQAFMFPAHMATATSQLVIAITSPAAIGVHLAHVPLMGEALPIAALSVGAIVGAQVGARVSRRISAPWLVRTLALGLGVAGVRLILSLGAF
ncbi:MAG: sulfite exporter TauE/SafE family protein [Chloroflexi bacterium]|nr:sulfite exporter TauE/SafE family protein [Chloroflexota bacterium]